MTRMRLIIVLTCMIIIKFVECDFDSELKAPDPSTYHNGGTVTYMMFPNVALPFNEARYVCQQNGGDLARIKNDDVLDSIIDLVEDKYNYADYFKNDYWLGIVRPTVEAAFYWVADCSRETEMDLVDDEYNSNELCYRFKKDTHYSERKSCGGGNAFLCEIYSSTPCSFASRLNTSALFSSIPTSTCENACNSNTYCWGTVQVETNKTCVLLMENSRGPDTVELTSKFCIDVAINLSSPDPPTDTSDVPNHSCPGPATAAPPATSPIGNVSSAICPTVTVTATPTTIIDTLSVTVNYTNTVTVTPTPVTVTNSITVTAISTPGAVTNTITVTASPSPITVTGLITVTATQSVSCANGLAPPVSNVPAEVIASITEELVKNLTVDVKQTSSHIRSLTSAQDSRASSQYIGFMGVLLIAVPMGIIVISDFFKIMSDCRQSPLRQVASKK